MTFSFKVSNVVAELILEFNVVFTSSTEEIKITNLAFSQATSE